MAGKKTRPEGYWKDIDNIIREAQQAIEKEGWETLPGNKILRQKGYTSLVSAIYTYHGKKQQFRELLGEEDSQKPREYWTSLDNTIKEAQKAMQKERWETLPSHKVLRERGHASLANAIHKYHGKIQTFRKLLGQENKRKASGHWKDIENVIKEAQEIMKKEKWETLPGRDIVLEYGYARLNYAIERYHGGFPAFREILRTHLNQPSESEQIESLLETYVNGGNDDE